MINQKIRYEKKNKQTKCILQKETKEITYAKFDMAFNKETESQNTEKSPRDLRGLVVIQI